MVDEELIKKSKEYAEKIYRILDGRKIKKDNLRELIVAGFLSLSREHHSSIILLLEKGIYSSAFALLRPLIDSIFRGLWVSLVASEEEIEKIYCTEYKFETKTYKYIKEIDKYNLTSTFHDEYKQIAPFLHDMTHGGIEQLSRQFDKEGSVFVSFSDKDLSSLLNNANVLISRLLIEYDKFQDDNTLKKLGEEIIRNKFE